MISIDLGTIEYYDGINNKFVYEEGGIVEFEYSLKVVYDWEGKWGKPFLKGDANQEELNDFFIRMGNREFKKDFLSESVKKKLIDYIENSHTATKFNTYEDSQNDNNSTSKAKLYTAEELYALMISANVPLEFENRNLNRLLTIMRIVASFNNPPKKMNKNDIYKQNRELNEARKRQMKTKG